MSTLDEVQLFLQDFKMKLGIWGIVFRDDRAKNVKTLLDLEITSAYRESILKALEVTDYSEGPNEDSLNKGVNMWIFGKHIKGQEVYIKITLGINGAQVICISFHIAEHPMSYPLKRQLL